MQSFLSDIYILFLLIKIPLFIRLKSPGNAICCVLWNISLITFYLVKVHLIKNPKGNLASCPFQGKYIRAEVVEYWYTYVVIYICLCVAILIGLYYFIFATFVLGTVSWEPEQMFRTVDNATSSKSQDKCKLWVALIFHIPIGHSFCSRQYLEIKY